jgi:cell division septal protein FtsQ
MAKKSSVKIPAIYFIRLIVFLFLGWMLFKAWDFLATSELFAVHDVVIDTSIQFIDTSDLKHLTGRNIFKVDLVRLHNKIKAQYPQIAELRVIRELPDRIKVLAKRRDPVIQANIKGKNLVLDGEAVALYYTPAPIELPLVTGVSSADGRHVLGGPLKAKTIAIALDIVRSFRSHGHTAQLKITSIDVSNLSKIDMSIGPTFHVILDQDNYQTRVGLLEMLLAQRKIDFKQVRYIDLRFSEPIFGENSEETK